MTISRRTVWFLTYCLVLLAVQWRTVAAVVHLATHDMTASHLILVPLVSAWLVYIDRRRVFESVRWNGRAALACVLIGTALWVVSATYATDSYDALCIAVLALVVMGVGGFVLCYGLPAARAARFALLFLAFAIPIPGRLLAAATSLLKAGSAATVSGLLTLLDAPYQREGFLFRLPSFAIEIADECSGIRSTIALVLTSLLAGHFVLTTGWKKTLLVAATLPVAILKNGIRIVTLVLLAMHVDRGILDSQLHHEGGILFYLLAIAILLPLVGVLRSSDRKIEQGRRPA